MPFDHQPRFERAGLGIKASMEDAAVALADAIADIEILLDDAHAQLIVRQFARQRAADESRADDEKIVGSIHSGARLARRDVFYPFDARSLVTRRIANRNPRF